MKPPASNSTSVVRSKGYSRGAMGLAASLQEQNAELQAERDALHRALKDARPLVAKWCAYQGNSPELHAKYLAPIDAALGGKK